MPASLCVSSNGVSIFLPRMPPLALISSIASKHAVAEIGAGHRAGAGQFENGRNVDSGLGKDRPGQPETRHHQ